MSQPAEPTQPAREPPRDELESLGADRPEWESDLDVDASRDEGHDESAGPITVIGGPSTESGETFGEWLSRQPPPKPPPKPLGISSLDPSSRRTDAEA